jgi:hypothetical protein
MPIGLASGLASRETLGARRTVLCRLLGLDSVSKGSKCSAEFEIWLFLRCAAQFRSCHHHRALPAAFTRDGRGGDHRDWSGKPIPASAKVEN